MGNIHILPTDKPSRLYRNLLTYKLFILENSVMDVSECNREYQNIYITSDEEIKEKDWCLNNDALIIAKSKCNLNNLNHWKKIILTTDQDLIKDGVQAIDDEFLEWFVKNPSCEEVKVWNNKEWNKGKCDISNYKIIIPKEEIKIIECYFIPSTNTSSSTICSNCGQEKFLHTIGEGIKVSTYIINTKEEPKQEGKVLTVKEVMKGRSSKYEFIDFDKQETLEEAAKRYAESNQYDLEYYDEGGYQGIEVKSFTEKLVDFTTKWQQERSYSKEEMIATFHYGHQIGMNSILAIQSQHSPQHSPKLDLEVLKKEWFEQFKKK